MSKSDSTDSQCTISTVAAQKQSKYWRILAWVVSLILLTAGLGAFLSKQVASGIFCLLLGGVLFPPFNLWVRKRTNGAFSRKVTALTAVALFIPLVIFTSKDINAQRLIEEKKAAIERHQRDSLQVLTKETRKRDEAAKKLFLDKYPFVTSEAYDNWIRINHDSATTIHHTLNAFLTAEKRKYDLMLAKNHTDSIEAARFVVEAEKKEEREEVKKEVSTSEQSSPKSSSNREPVEYQEEYYQGHKVHTGPRGGKYIIVNGKQKYLSSK